LFTFKTSKDTLLNYFKQVARSNEELDAEKIHELNLQLDEDIRKSSSKVKLPSSVPTSHNSSFLTTERDVNTQLHTQLQ
jgi:hypothetical protein